MSVPYRCMWACGRVGVVGCGVRRDGERLERLHHAAKDPSQSASLKRCKRLLKSGAAVDQRLPIGGLTDVTPLMCAAEVGNEAVVNLLLKHEAATKACDGDGNAPLAYAARSGEISTAALLIEGGAKVKAKNHRGETAFMSAAQAGQVETLAMLLAHDKSGLRACSTDGRTPLMYAASNPEATGPATVLLLLDCGANPLAKVRAFNSTLNSTIQRPCMACTTISQHSRVHAPGTRLCGISLNVCLHGSMRCATLLCTQDCEGKTAADHAADSQAFGTPIRSNAFSFVRCTLGLVSPHSKALFIYMYLDGPDCPFPRTGADLLGRLSPPTTVHTTSNASAASSTTGTGHGARASISSRSSSRKRKR